MPIQGRRTQVVFDLEPVFYKSVRFPAYQHTFASGSLNALNLYNNKIGDAGAKAIADAIGASGSLAELNLRYNQIGDEGAKALAGAIGASGSLALKVLWVSSNHAELVAACKSKGVKLHSV